jgi:hypothetical protein
MMLETRSRTMLLGLVSKDPGSCFSTARKVSLPPVESSRWPRRLSRGLGVSEYALWKSVSESSVVPVSAGVRAGVTGVIVRGRLEHSATEASSLLFFEELELPVIIVVVVGGGRGGGRSVWA